MTFLIDRTRRLLALQALLACAVLNACGGGGSADTPAPPPAVEAAPTITAQPQDASVAEGLSATFSVAASGSGTLSYQWQRGGADVAGATSTTLSIGAAGIADHQAAYRVRVSNAAGSVFSRTATLSVQAASGTALALLAGAMPPEPPMIGAWDPLDGTGAAARLGFVTSMTSDGTGNVYITEQTSVRKITPAGAVTTLAGRGRTFLAGAPSGIGFADGQGSNALFRGLSGIVVANDGSLYVADSFNRVIRRVSLQGEVRTLAGSPGVEGTADGALDQARFGLPIGLARDRAGNIYVLDGTYDLCVDDNVFGSVAIFAGFKVRKISPAGLVTTLPNASVVPSTSTATLLPGAIAVDADDNVYVSVTETPRPGAIFAVACGSFRRPATAAYILKITPTGQVSVLAGSRSQAGAADGVAAAARFKWPSQLAVDRQGAVLVADTDNQAVRRIDPNGQVTTAIGELSATPSTTVSLGALPGRLLYVTSLAVLPADAIALFTGQWFTGLVLRTERR